MVSGYFTYALVFVSKCCCCVTVTQLCLQYTYLITICVSLRAVHTIRYYGNLVAMLGLMHATQKNPESGSAFSRAMIGSIRFEQPHVDFSTSKNATAPSKRHASHPVTCIISKAISSEGLITNFAIFWEINQEDIPFKSTIHFSIYRKSVLVLSAVWNTFSQIFRSVIKDSWKTDRTFETHIILFKFFGFVLCLHKIPRTR